MTQLGLFVIENRLHSLSGGQLSLADLDELMTYVQGGRWDTHYMPYPWVASELTRILGRDIPVVRYRRDAYLELLDEAHRTLGGRR